MVELVKDFEYERFGEAAPPSREKGAKAQTHEKHKCVIVKGTKCRVQEVECAGKKIMLSVSVLSSAAASLGSSSDTAGVHVYN